LDLQETQSNWEEFGVADPLWAILSAPGKRGGRWDPEEFFDTGREEIETALKWVEEAGLRPGRRRALDFGCGVGRLTQALCEHFDEADGVDIAASMIERAQALNRFGERCSYHVNSRPDLSRFEDGRFDFVYSVLVLQHVEPRYALSYLDEFARLLAPGGVAVVQLPAGPAPDNRLPEGSYLADVRLGRLPISVRAGAALDVPVRIRNAGPYRWPRRGINVGNHWRTRRLRVCTLDDGRAPLPRDLEPGEQASVTLSVTAPTVPGWYVLEVDLVHEGIRWFAAGKKNRIRAMRPMRVRAGDRSDETAAPAEPVMEMHAVARADVEARLARRGVAVVAAREDGRAGDNFVSYTYLAVKRG
jgi:SAM-dependent methyltransferase